MISHESLVKRLTLISCWVESLSAHWFGTGHNIVVKSLPIRNILIQFLQSVVVLTVFKWRRVRVSSLPQIKELNGVGRGWLLLVFVAVLNFSPLLEFVVRIQDIQHLVFLTFWVLFSYLLFRMGHEVNLLVSALVLKHIWRIQLGKVKEFEKYTYAEACWPYFACVFS